MQLTGPLHVCVDGHVSAQPVAAGFDRQIEAVCKVLGVVQVDVGDSEHSGGGVGHVQVDLLGVSGQAVIACRVPPVRAVVHQLVVCVPDKVQQRDFAVKIA